MAAADNDGNNGQQWWQTTMVADDNNLQDWAADYEVEGQEWVARVSRDSRVAMMTATKMAAAEDRSGGQQWQ
jgi:hypothetical protein